jgi:mannose-6-phosphate isomerase-like protein (cupin superfamily)
VPGYTIKQLEEVPDVSGEYPGEMRFCTRALGTEQVAFTHRRVPPGAGGRGSYGHSHKTQEEVYFVVSGTLTFKLGDDVVELGPGTLVKVPPEVVRSVHNDGSEDAHLVIVSARKENLEGEVVFEQDFWPE